jgi:hypothetical protein
MSVERHKGMRSLKRCALRTAHCALTAALVTAAFAGRLPAQHQHDKPGRVVKADTGDATAQAAAEASMAGHLTADAHMRMTPRRPPNAKDSARAAATVRELRSELAKYADPKAAEADGYRLFAPEMKSQPVYHYTHWGHAARNAFSFDATRPTSLLYKRAANGSMQLVGAMYTAPKRASLDDLDKRIPLSVAQWHLHTNWCVPGRNQKDRWRETLNGKPKFGPTSDMDTKAECDAVGGTFHPVLFNWMVHANVFEQDVWGDDHGSGGHKH